jgi:hypothetical protein
VRPRFASGTRGTRRDKPTSATDAFIYGREAGAMHPVVRDFCERRPRLYGLLAMIVALGVAQVGRIVSEPLSAFYLFLLSSMFVVTSAAYLVFGARVLGWDWYSEAYLSPFTSWRTALRVIGLALGLLVPTGLLYWLLR